jgi:hypothetical protein
MVDETSEQKQLNNRVGVVDKTCGPLIDGELAVPMRKIRASGTSQHQHKPKMRSWSVCNLCVTYFAVIPVKLAGVA